MDKYEYKVRSEEIKRLIGEGDYVQAAEIADTIDWRRVKSIMMLCTVSDLYKVNRRYEDAKNMLLLAYERRQGGRTICYSLCELCIKTEDFVQAVNYYKEFVQAAPKDSGRYILQYKIYEAQDVSLEERIGVLEELKKRDYREKWAYELAYLYHRVGLATRCVEECDELILWFGEGKYVVKAMELKMLHQALTPAQQEAYDHRYDRQEQEQAEEYADAQGEESFSGEEAYGEENQDMPPETEEYYETSGLWQEDEEQAAGEEYPEETPEELDIQVKTMDVGQFNTINLQEELAAGLQEVLGAEEVRRGIPEPEGRETAFSPSPEDGPTAEEPDTEDEEVEVFFGETGEIGDVPLEDLRETPGREAEDQMSSLRTGTPYPARFAQGSVQENAKLTEFESEESEPSGAEEAGAEWEESGRNGAQGTGAESEELERTEARRTGVEPGELERNEAKGTGAEWEGLERNGAKGTGAEPDELERNGVQETGAEWEESGRNGAQGTGVEWEGLERNGAKGTGVEPEESVGRETSGPAAGNRRERSVRKAEERQDSTEDTGLLVMEQMRREAENGKELNSTVQSQPPKEMAGVLSQEANGQIRLVMPDNVALEKQITGQMNIQDILSEWERMKKENQEKCREEVRQHVLQQTGPMFTEFEAAVRDGLLEQLETGRVTNAQLQEKAQARGESVTGRAGTLEDPENSEKAFKDALDGRETGGIEEEWIPEKGEEIDEFLASDGCWEGEGEEDLETEGEAYEEQAGYFEDAEAFEGEIEDPEEVEILEEESEDPEDAEAFEEETGDPEEDAEAFEEETGDPEEDAEALEEDAEDLEEDAGAFEEESEDLEEDAEAFEEESEDLEEDAEAFEEDAEDLEEDAGAFEEDAEDLEEDAEAFGEDAENPEEDAEAFEEDAENPEEDAADEETAKDSGKADRGKRTPAKSRRGKNAAASNGEKDGPQRQPIERDRAKVRALTREEKELYAPFIQSRRSREQLVKAIDNVSMAAYTGNIVITGEEGMDTLSLAKNMIREVQLADSNFSGQVAKISGQGLNQRNVRKTLEEMNGGALIIYKASGMTVDTARNLYRSLQQERLGIIVVLEDTKKAMQKMFLGTPELVGAFTARFDMEALSNDMLVLFGKRYAREMEFSIDELGVLALHTRIEELQTIDHVVTVVDVKKIVDEAIHHASRKTLGHFFDVLFARRYDEEDMIILTEKDFVA